MPRDPHLAHPGLARRRRDEGTLGILAQLRDDYDSAERSYRQVLEIFTRLGDQKNMATRYHQLGILAQLRGDDDTAEPLYRRSLDIKERIGNQAGTATSYHQLGILAQLRGDDDTAEPLYRRALDTFERIGDQASTATSCANLGRLSEALGNLDQAVGYRVRALAIRLRIGTATAADLEPLTGLRCQLGRDRFRAPRWPPAWTASPTDIPLSLGEPPRGSGRDVTKVWSQVAENGPGGVTSRAVLPSSGGRI